MKSLDILAASLDEAIDYWLIYSGSIHAKTYMCTLPDHEIEVAILETATKKVLISRKFIPSPLIQGIMYNHPETNVQLLNTILHYNETPLLFEVTEIFETKNLTSAYEKVLDISKELVVLYGDLETAKIREGLEEIQKGMIFERLSFLPTMRNMGFSCRKETLRVVKIKDSFVYFLSTVQTINRSGQIQFGKEIEKNWSKDGLRIEYTKDNKIKTLCLFGKPFIRKKT